MKIVTGVCRSFWPVYKAFEEDLSPQMSLKLRFEVRTIKKDLSELEDNNGSYITPNTL